MVANTCPLSLKVANKYSHITTLSLSLSLSLEPMHTPAHKVYVYVTVFSVQ